MKPIKRYAFPIIIICSTVFFSSCNNLNNSNNKSDVIEKESHSSVNTEKSSEEKEKIVWNEINEHGVDENLLIKNIDVETLTYVAQQFQGLCTEISEKGQKDKNYWLTGQWHSDVVASKQYNNVVSLNKKAIKPLFLIIYKSPNSGMYEWVCSKALDEISDFDFSGENNWSNSKEFIEMFINKIIEQRN